MNAIYNYRDDRKALSDFYESMKFESSGWVCDARFIAIAREKLRTCNFKNVLV